MTVRVARRLLWAAACVGLIVLIAIWRGWTTRDFGDFFWIGLGWLGMVPLLQLLDRWADGNVSGAPDLRRPLSEAMLPVGIGLMLVGAAGWLLSRR